MINYIDFRNDTWIHTIYTYKIGCQKYHPLYHSAIAAGFPSPADDYIDNQLDLTELLIQHPSATFFLRVSGSSMEGAGIYHGDLLIVDRSLEAEDGKIVIAVLDGEMTVKRLHRDKQKLWLLPENPLYPNLEISEDMQFEIWGVVVHVIHSL